MQVVLIGCDTHTSISIRLALQLRWSEVKIIPEATRRRGLQLLRNASPDVVCVTLDAAQPDIHTLEFLQAARVISEAILVALTQQPSDQEHIACLEAGADSYIRLPINGPMLLAHILAVLRRTGRLQQMDRISLAGGRLTLNPLTYEVDVGGQHLHLTPTEFKLLLHLAKERNRVVPHNVLQDLVWGYDDSESPYGLRKYIHRLRQKLNEAIGDQVQILAVPCVGYQLVDDALEAEV